MLTERQKKILHLIIESYIKEAQPISSGFLAKKIGGQISPATIRNEMLELERARYIEQPHTSAGRIPTGKAYQWLVEEKIIGGKILRQAQDDKRQVQDDKWSIRNDKKRARNKRVQNDKTSRLLGKLIIKKGLDNRRESVKEIAKHLALESDSAVIAVFGESDNYYTGLSNLFSQPEFKEQAKVVDISELIEKFDIIIKEICREVGAEPAVLIGRKGRFGGSCSFVAASADGILIGILGAMRMNYEKNYQLINEAVKLINKLYD
ncbi:hypothetical protein HZB94_04335 [Candidatus Falkowbacteria bacterium]|nr:hypothetical protein [Candidatus Falkowbacteria bacterium]